MTVDRGVPFSTTFPPLSPLAWLRRPRAERPFPLADPSCHLFARARHGLFHGLRALGLRPGDEVLAPAYHHGSEIEALREAGLAPRFYEAREDLAPDPAELEALLGPRARALHLIHYLGWPQDSARWRAWCDERNLLLLEDAAQAWLARPGGRPVGALADLAIFSLYKTVPVPDGGALVLRGPSPGRPGRGARGVRGALALHLAAAAQRIPALAAVEARGSGPYDPTRDFALGRPWRAPSRATRVLLARVADPGAAARRRAHARALIAAGGGRVPAPFGAVPDGASPFVLPIADPEPAKLIARLRRRGVQGVRLWAVPHPSLPAGAFPQAARRRATTVVVPVHQELRPADVARIADALEEAA